MASCYKNKPTDYTDFADQSESLLHKLLHGFGYLFMYNQIDHVQL
jgi:hypothetical protein